MKRLPNEKIVQLLLRITSCDLKCVQSYISAIEKVAINRNINSTMPIKIETNLDPKTQKGASLNIDGLNFILTNEALDNLRRSTAEAILFLERQSS